MRYTAHNNYIDNENGETVYIADSDRDAREIARLMIMIPGYNPPTEAEQRCSNLQIKVTASVLLDRGLWDRACKLTGLNVWAAINEGLINLTDEVTFTLAQAQELGLLEARGISSVNRTCNHVRFTLEQLLKRAMCREVRRIKL